MSDSERVDQVIPKEIGVDNGRSTEYSTLPWAVLLRKQSISARHVMHFRIRVLRVQSCAGCTLITMVEGTLFRVHKLRLTEHSHVFADMFSVPQPDCELRDGASEEHPISLTGILFRKRFPDWK
ncbi:hypothetical protein PENSPDRAFT_738018 [Peniophora sp. CONT]|nr:hypothetical protein PENSPDRAFT_738018 [Peniophora sp. CONT]